MSQGKFHSSPLKAETLEAICAFNAALTNNLLDVGRQRDVLTKIITGPDKVCDVTLKGERVGVGVLIDACDNTYNSAELSLLVPKRNEEVMDLILGWALPLIKEGSRTSIDLPEWKGLEFPITWLKRHGFTPGYHMFEMECHSPNFTPLELPRTWNWMEYSERFFHSYYETLRESFKEIPGCFIPEESVFKERSETHSPKAHILVEGEKVVGFVRVQMKSPTVGDLAILGRHPNFRKKGVGPFLVERGLKHLKQLGAKEVSLEVAAVNQRALELYQKYGFVTKSQMTVYQRKI